MCECECGRESRRWPPGVKKPEQEEEEKNRMGVHKNSLEAWVRITSGHQLKPDLSPYHHTVSSHFHTYIQSNTRIRIRIRIRIQTQTRPAGRPCLDVTSAVLCRVRPPAAEMRDEK